MGNGDANEMQYLKTCDKLLLRQRARALPGEETENGLGAHHLYSGNLRNFLPNIFMWSLLCCSIRIIWIWVSLDNPFSRSDKIRSSLIIQFIKTIAFILISSQNEFILEGFPSPLIFSILSCLYTFFIQTHSSCPCLEQFLQTGSMVFSHCVLQELIGACVVCTHCVNSGKEPFLHIAPILLPWVSFNPQAFLLFSCLHYHLMAIKFHYTLPEQLEFSGLCQECSLNCEQLSTCLLWLK